MIRILLLAFVLFPGIADAASFYVSPASGSYEVGERVTVTIFAESSTSLNAVAGTLIVPSTGFEIVSVSYAGSVPNFWVQAPTALGSTVKFEGVVLNPGYTGSAGKIASVSLRAKSTGTHAFSFSNASILANDGKGTNILTGTRGSTYTVKEATAKPIVAPEPKEEPAPVVEETPVVEEVATTSIPEEVGAALPWAPWQLWVLVLILIGIVFWLLALLGNGGASHESARRFLAHSFGVMRKNIKKEESLLRNRHDAAAEREKDLLDTLEENIDTTEKRLTEELSHTDPQEK